MYKIDTMKITIKTLLWCVFCLLVSSRLVFADGPNKQMRDMAFAAYSQADKYIFFIYGDKIKKAIDNNTPVEVHVNFVVVDKYKELTKYPLIAKITAVIFNEKSNKTLMGNKAFRIDADKVSGSKYEFNVLLEDPVIESQMKEGGNKKLSASSMTIPKVKLSDSELGKHSEALRQLVLSIPESELVTYLYAGSKTKEKDGHLDLSPAPTAIKLKEIMLEYTKQTK